MPVDMHRYPKNWQDIARRVKEQQNWHCAWCGAPHGRPHYKTGSMVILTVHHLGVPKPDHSAGDMHDKMDCRDENLVGLCQRCHLWADRNAHRLNAAITRRRKHIEAGQLEII